MANEGASTSARLKPEISLPDVLAVTAAAATVAASAFLLGKSHEIGVSVVYFMSPQDIILGVIYLFPLELIMALLFFYFRSQKSTRFSDYAVVVVGSIVGALIVWRYLGGGTDVAILLVAAMLTGCAGIWLARFQLAASAAILGIGFGFVLPLALGTIFGSGSMKETTPVTIEFINDEPPLTGSLFQVSANYLFVTEGSKVHFVHVADVKTMTVR